MATEMDHDEDSDTDVFFHVRARNCCGETQTSLHKHQRIGSTVLVSPRRRAANGPAVASLFLLVDANRMMPSFIMRMKLLAKQQNLHKRPVSIHVVGDEVNGLVLHLAGISKREIRRSAKELDG